MYGVGASNCAAQGFTRFGPTTCYDAVDCVTFFFVPLVPFRVVHVITTDTQSRTVRLRWTAAPVFKAFARRWLWALLFVGAILTLALLSNRPPAQKAGQARGGLVLIAMSGLGWFLLSRLEVRTRSVRVLLGPHPHGTSDPATWPADLLPGLTAPQQIYGTRAFADAVEPLMIRGEFSRAMWAARLSTACEDAAAGERLTDTILSSHDVQQALAAVRADAAAWAKAMVPGGERSAG